MCILPVGDTVHPQSKDIYAKLTCCANMKEMFTLSSDHLWQKVKDGMLEVQGEKLAVMCGLVNTPKGMPVCVASNSRELPGHHSSCI